MYKKNESISTGYLFLQINSHKCSVPWWSRRYFILLIRLGTPYPQCVAWTGGTKSFCPAEPQFEWTLWGKTFELPAGTCGDVFCVTSTTPLTSTPAPTQSSSTQQSSTDSSQSSTESSTESSSPAPNNCDQVTRKITDEPKFILFWCF